MEATDNNQDCFESSAGADGKKYANTLAEFIANLPSYDPLNFSEEFRAVGKEAMPLFVTTVAPPPEQIIVNETQHVLLRYVKNREAQEKEDYEIAREENGGGSSAGMGRGLLPADRPPHVSDIMVARPLQQRAGGEMDDTQFDVPMRVLNPPSPHHRQPL